MSRWHIGPVVCVVLAAVTLVLFQVARAWDSPTPHGEGVVTAGYWVTPTADEAEATAGDTITISPSTLDAAADGEPVVVQLAVALPDDCVLVGVDLASAHLGVVDGASQVGAQSVDGSDADASDGKLHATITFAHAEVVALLTDAGRTGDVELEVSGQAWRCAWSGTDTIRFVADDADTTTQNTLAPEATPTDTPTTTPTEEPPDEPTTTPEPTVTTSPTPEPSAPNPTETPTATPTG